MRQAATDACAFVAGLSKDDFIADKRTQQAVVMSLIIVGEAALPALLGHLRAVHLAAEREDPSDDGIAP